MHRARALVVVFGLLVVLGHVCALPADAAHHAPPVGHGHGPHDQSPADSSLHGASCEALRPTSVAAPVVLSPAPTGAVFIAPLIGERPLDRPTPAPAVSPPLFLLHASLLI